MDLSPLFCSPNPFIFLHLLPETKEIEWCPQTKPYYLPILTRYIKVTNIADFCENHRYCVLPVRASLPRLKLSSRVLISPPEANPFEILNTRPYGDYYL